MQRDRPLNKISRSPSLSRYRWTHTRTVLSLVAPGVFSTSAAPSSAAAACLRRKTTSVISTWGSRFGCLALITQVESSSQTQSTRDLRFLKSMATNTTYHNYSEEGESRILRNADTLLPAFLAAASVYNRWTNAKQHAGQLCSPACLLAYAYRRLLPRS